MKKTRLSLSMSVLAALAAVLTACGGSKVGPGVSDDETAEAGGGRGITSAPISGNVQAASFSLGAATARKVNSTKGEILLITLAPEGTASDCFNPYPSTGAYVLAAAPPTPGLYEASGGQDDRSGVAFMNNTASAVASYSQIRIDSIEGDVVKGGIYAESSDSAQSRISGEFTATLCPY